jgi:FKBP-type peptidyl-prolyl cis-trans isomerase FkpA
MYTLNSSSALCRQIQHIVLPLILSYGVIVFPATAEPLLITTSGGLQLQELVKGSGEPAQTGQTVRIHFVGWIDEQGQKGKALYNSRSEGKPISFVLGTKKMMPAFKEGIVGMKAGGRRLLRVPPKFAYGKRGVDDVIPPNTSLILLVDLLAIEGS